MLSSPLFGCPNKDTYPPFKCGQYLEEYFHEFMSRKASEDTKRKYIPVKWTNFQIEGWFPKRKSEMQMLLDDWVRQNPSVDGYFTVVQYDDGPLLSLPANTIVYGACSGDIPIPLIYEDKNNTLERFAKKTYKDKQILCSFVGNRTSNHLKPNVREEVFRLFGNDSRFTIIDSGGWSPNVSRNLQQTFIDTTIDSKFALAPRGYGRSSFRFFECFQLGTIPVYLYNDMNWLPFQDAIDYEKLCVVLHVSQMHRLPDVLLAISEEKYNSMWDYYHEIKEYFGLEGMSRAILDSVQKTHIKILT